jgi:hypothetical protein
MQFTATATCASRSSSCVNCGCFESSTLTIPHTRAFNGRCLCALTNQLVVLVADFPEKSWRTSVYILISASFIYTPVR